MLNAPNSPLNLITEDTCLVNILEDFELKAFNESTIEQIFTTICKYNMRKSLELFKKMATPLEIIKYAKVKDAHGINAIMMAAMASSDQVLMTLIADIFLSQNCNFQEINEFLHDQDPEGRTLLNIIMAQGEVLNFAKEMMIKIERDFHRNEGSKTVTPLVKCFQDKLGPSRDAAKALKDEKTYLAPSRGIIKNWIKVFLELLFPLTIYLQDVITDSLLTVEYYQDFMNETSSDNHCDIGGQQLQSSCKGPNESFPQISAMSAIPKELANGPRFYYCLSFMVIPIGFYFFEWYLQESQRLSRQVSKTSFSINL